MPEEHLLVDASRGGPLPEFDVRHHEVLLVGVLQHISQVSLQPHAQQEATSNLLDLYDLLSTLIEVDLHVVARSVATIQRLDQDGGTVSLEDAAQSVDVDLKIEQVLFGTFFLRVIGYVQFHELVEASEPVTERRVFNALFISDHKVVESHQRLNRVHQEVTVARNRADRVREERQVHDLRQ